MPRGSAALTTVALAALLASTPACTMSRSSSRTLTAAGAVVAIAGAVVARPTAVDSDHDGTNDSSWNDDYSGVFVGSLLLVSGLVMVGAGLAAEVPPEPPAPVMAAPAARPLAPGSTTAASPAAFAMMPTRPRALEAPGVALPRTLPELATTPDLLRMAQAVRSTVLRGECEAAWTTIDAIARQDAAYAAALVAGPVLEGCRR